MGSFKSHFKVPGIVRPYRIALDQVFAVRNILVDVADDGGIGDLRARKTFYAAPEACCAVSEYQTGGFLQHDFEFRAFVFCHRDSLAGTAVFQDESAVQGIPGNHERSADGAITVGAHLLAGKLLPIGIIKSDLLFQTCPCAKRVLGGKPAIALVIDRLSWTVNRPVSYQSAGK